MPPEFGEVNYWDERFAKDQTSFEWLKTPDEILPALFNLFASIPKKERRVLHIGPGSSQLSLVLKGLVTMPEHVHNIDFSTHALDLGMEMETQAADLRGDDTVNSYSNRMRWSRVDLLVAQDIRNLLNAGPCDSLYNVIVDKSTCDSVACGKDVELDPISFCAFTENISSTSSKLQIAQTIAMWQKEMVHPVHLLSLHLATLTSPGGYWFAISYSEDRFSFLTGSSERSAEDGDHDTHLLCPSRYWAIERKEAIPDTSLVPNHNEAGSVVYRPPNIHWLYILKRTSYALKLTI